MRWLKHNGSASFPKLVSKIRIGQFEESFFFEEFLPQVHFSRPWDTETVSLLEKVEHFYTHLTLSNLRKIEPFVTPKFAIPRPVSGCDRCHSTARSQHGQYVQSMRWRATMSGQIGGQVCLSMAYT